MFTCQQADGGQQQTGATLQTEEDPNQTGTDRQPGGLPAPPRPLRLLICKFDFTLILI